MDFEAEILDLDLLYEKSKKERFLHELIDILLSINNLHFLIWLEMFTVVSNIY